MPMLPVSRSSDVPQMPGHAPSIISPAVRPTAMVIKRLASTVPSRHDSPFFAFPLQQSTKSTAVHNGTAPGHNPQSSPTAVQPTAQDGNHGHSSPGRAQSSILQHGKATRKPILQTRSRPAVAGFSRTNNAVLYTENKNPGQTSSETSTSDTRTPDLVVRRPRIGVSMRQATDGSPFPTVNARRACTPETGRSIGAVGVSVTNCRQVILDGTKHSPAIPTTGAGHAPQRQSKSLAMGGAVSTGLFGPNNSILRSAISQIGSLFARTVLSVAGAWQSSLSFASCSEELMYRGLSFAGKHLMSAKKGLQLYHKPAFWSA